MEEIAVLSEAECAQARDDVHRMRELWLPRERGVPFYTLGAVSYLDTRQDRSGKVYEELAEKYNALLMKEFGWLYQKLSAVLQTKLESEVYRSEKFALPGFHIFLAHPFFQHDDLAFKHFDLQYKLLKWRDPQLLDLANPLSFTMAVALPKHGGGMYKWDIPYSENVPKDEFLAKAGVLNRRLLRYRIGVMILHKGHHLHQIAPFFNLQPDDERITLQGHIIRYAGKWIYYW
jgi:hypothetical protein